MNVHLDRAPRCAAPAGRAAAAAPRARCSRRCWRASWPSDARQRAEHRVAQPHGGACAAGACTHPRAGLSAAAQRHVALTLAQLRDLRHVGRPGAQPDARPRRAHHRRAVAHHRAPAARAAAARRRTRAALRDAFDALREAQAAYWQATQQAHQELVALAQAPNGAPATEVAMARTEARRLRPSRHSASAPHARTAGTDEAGHAARRRPRQTVLVLQGGGALGAYQVGVYQALHEAGIEPDWVIGTSIGAINAALIAGNEPARPAWSGCTRSGTASSSAGARRGLSTVAGPGQPAVANLHDRVARHPELLRAQPGARGRHARAARRRGARRTTAPRRCARRSPTSSTSSA